MKVNTKFTKRLFSVFLSFIMILSYIPMGTIMASADSNSTSVADLKTLNTWESWFAPDSSRYAGGVFLDKSVYTAGEAKSDNYFADIRDSLSFGNDNFGNENFMIALSALGSNSEVLGYSHIPTDTVLVLDASTSMGTGAADTSSVDDMVNGANEAIKRLLSLNNYNRVGVVIYNGTASVLLPLDRYTANGTNGDILRFDRIRTGGRGTWRDPYTYENRIYIASDVVDGEGNDVGATYNAQAQGTYTQGGIYAAAQEFLNADTVIEDGKIQGGTNRIPIMVLMSDGEPSYRTQTGSNNTINKYNTATNNNADRSEFREDDITAFSTMLTAAWAEAEITAHYNMDTRFYTLGYALSANHRYAQNVLDPLNPNNALATRFQGYASQYLAMNQNATAVIRNENNDEAFRVTRASSPDKVTSLDYVDRYWQAAQASQLTSAFDAIVDEIVVQSRYYSTLVSGSNYAQDGYVSFTDEIGTHMEVKDIKGLYIGDGKLVSGGMFAEFATTGKVEDYDNSNYSDAELEVFENEILNAVADRFGISLSEATLLINNAKDNGQISYTSPTEFSNYIAWYADKDNNYLAPYSEVSAHNLDEAQYIVRSYFYMGDVTQNHVETSMLYALVRVREDIKTGRQIVDMDIPAALIPLVTYTITVDGDVLTSENITGLTCKHKKPISLLFEVGLDSEINPVNIAEKVDSSRSDQNGVYTFYTNRWRDDSLNEFVLPTNVDPHVFNHGTMNTTVVQFIPSLENERYYYTENAQILDSSYNAYTGARPDSNGTYYTLHKWVEGNANGAALKTNYNPVSSVVFDDEENIFSADGNWYVKKGTPEVYFGEQVHGEQGHSHKEDDTITETLGFSLYPQIVHHDSEGHTGYHLLSYLGNNGKVTATSAQGIRLSKTVSGKVEGAADSFDFEIALTAPVGTLLDSSYYVYFEHKDGTATQPVSVNVVNNKLNVTLADGDVAYIYDLPVGTEYTVTELYNEHYTASSANNSGTVALHTLSSVDFVNAPKGYGSLLVEKDVTHPFETISPELENEDFSITVEFTGDANDLGQIVATDNEGYTFVANIINNKSTYQFNLKDGHDVMFTDIPDGVEYTVTENSIPQGYSLVTDPANLQGRIATNIQSEVLLVNDYDPAPVTPDISISGEKRIVNSDGSDKTWTDADVYNVMLQQIVGGGAGEHVAIGNPISATLNKDNKGYTLNVSDLGGGNLLQYDKVGTYTYIVYEETPADENDRVEHIKYDTTFLIFSVEVVDHGTGQLSIGRVTELPSGTAITENNGAYELTKNFTNYYETDTVEIPVLKTVEAPDGTAVTGHSGGMLFGLFTSPDAATHVYSTITADDGTGKIVIPVLRDDFQTEKTFYLRELMPPHEIQVVGMTYNTEVKYVVTVVWGASEAEYHFYNYDVTETNGIGTEITSKTDPLTITNVYEANERSTPAIDLGGKKTVNGGALRSGDEFTFELYETDADFDVTGHARLKSATVDSATADAEYFFDGITFNSVGTKYLVVRESKAGTTVDGITYDNTRYHITVDVTKTATADNKVVLEATMTHVHKVGYGTVSADELDFNNKYTVNDREEVVIKGKKELSGRTLIEGEFTFALYEKGATEPKYTVTNEADGDFTFPALEFSVSDEVTLDKTYEYEVVEVVPTASDNKGITYNSDGKVKYEIEVNLKDDGKGGITKTVKVDGQETADVNVAFENSYTAAPTSLNLGGTKTFNKSSGEFHFDLYETNSDFAITSTPLKTARAELTGGVGTYGITLDYTKAHRGYHYYVVKEAVPAETKGILYDVAEYHITVNVLDNGNGEMEAHVMRVVKEHTDENVTATTLNFSNEYRTSEASVILAGKKNLQGRDLEDNEFKFLLYPADPDFKVQDGTTAMETTNDTDGNFSFGSLTFENVGTYNYVVREDAETTADRVTNDQSVYNVTVVIADDGEGKLYEADRIIKKAGSDDSETAIVFNNVYTPKPDDITVDFGVIKTVENKGSEKMGPEGFEFVLENTDTNEKVSVESDAEGNAKFTLAYTETDIGKTYNYKLTEVNDGRDNVTYSTEEYKITVAVSLNGNNELVATLTMDGEAATEIVASFRNIYDYTITDIVEVPEYDDTETETEYEVEDEAEIEEENEPEEDVEAEAEEESEGEDEAEYPENPKTGESTNLTLLFALLFVSGGAMATLTVCDKRKLRRTK